MSTPRVKICCISSIEEAQLAIEHGASAVGLVGPMPSGPGVIDDELIRQIARSVPPPIASFLLTSHTNATDIIRHHKAANTSTIQMVDTLEEGDYEELRAALPMVKLVQVIHVNGQHSIREAVEASKFVDAILLDSGNPHAAIKTLGGTGQTHNWEWSREIRASISIPVFLAGGLNKDNVQLALKTVRPFGIDLCSGVRTDGKLDEAKLKAFFNAIEA